MILSIIALVVLSLAIPLGLYSAPSWGTDALLLYGVLLLCSLKLSLLIYKAEYRPIAFTFWIFVYTWGALSAIMQVSTDRFPWPIFHSFASQRSAIWLMLLAIICFEAGYIRQSQYKTYARWQLQLDPRKVLYIGALVAIWTLIAIFMFGGPEALMQHRGLARQALKGSASSVAERIIRDTSLHGPIFIHVLIIGHLALSGLRGRETLSRNMRLSLLWLLAALLPLHFIANYPNAQTRAWLGALVVAPALLFMPKNRRFIFAFIVGFIVATIIVFPALDANRSAKVEDQGLFAKFVLDEHTLARAREQMVKGGDYDVFQMFCNGVEYVQQNGILWGSNLAGAALFWIPRSLWPEKPIASGTVVGLYFDNPNVNLSSPLWMEFHMAFGGLGVILLMFLYGRSAAYIDNRFQHALETDRFLYNAFPILAAFWAGHQFLMLRGSLIYGTAIASVPILVLLLSASRPRPAPAASAPHPETRAGLQAP